MGLDSILSDPIPSKEVVTLGNPNADYDPYEDGYDDEQAEEIKAWEESGERFRKDMSDDDDD